MCFKLTVYVHTHCTDVKSTPESGEESRKEVSPLKSGDDLRYEESPGLWGVESWMYQ